METPPRTGIVERTTFSRLLREPTIHFFVIAAAVFLVHRLVQGDPRTIEITPALEADLLRRYQDQLNRPPTPGEAAQFMAAWKAEEALYREAVREGIDRDDATIRGVLIAKMRERLLLQTRLREPTDAELRQYLETHRGEFEAPLLFEHEYLVFPKQKPGAARERDRYERLLAGGSSPASLGLRSTVANVDRQRIEQAFGAEVADAVRQLPVGQWQKLETGDRLLLVKLVRIHGGLPEPALLRERLVAGWKGAMAQEALAQATRAVAERYHFEEKPR
jgi:hypothetical protein